MANINLADLKPGMVLAADACSAGGRVLLRAGSELTAKHLAMFATLGLVEADIAGIDKQNLDAVKREALDPQALAAAERAMRDHFRYADLDHPAIAELYNLLVLRHALKQGSENGR